MKKLMVSTALILVGLQPVSASDVDQKALENSIPYVTEYVAMKEKEACDQVAHMEKQNVDAPRFKENLDSWKKQCDTIKGQMNTLKAGGAGAINLIKNSKNPQVGSIVANEKAKLGNTAPSDDPLGGPL